MIAYHPAFDPYHAAFRIVRLLLAANSPLEVARVRLLDFHLVFPSAIGEVRLPRQLGGWRAKAKRFENRYWYNGERWLLYNRMKPFFDSGLSVLYGAAVVDRPTFDNGLLAIASESLRFEALLASASRKNAEETDLIDLLVNRLREIPLTGQDGLKDRTSLMEFRYDAPRSIA